MKKIVACIGIGLIVNSVKAQVGIGTATPNSSAQLEVSAANKGLLIPRIVMASRPASPATGLLIYQTDNTPGFYYYDGTAWKLLETGGNNWSLNGNTVSASNFLGTTNSTDFHIKVNNVTSGVIDGNSKNTAFGYEALPLNSAIYGVNNTAFGFQALNGNNAGNGNTAIGFQSLVVNNGGGNCAIGAVALYRNASGSYNVAVGNNALQENVTGNANVAMGAWALYKHTAGFRNVAMGYNALQSLTGGDDNTALGYNAGTPAGTFSNTTALGSGATISASNMVCIGNAAVTTIGGYAGWTNLSDIRFKKDIAPQTHGLDLIMQLQPIVYRLDMEKLNAFTYGKSSDSMFQSSSSKEAIRKKESILYSGFSAQQVEQAAKHVGYSFSAVHQPENDKDHYTLDYAAFVVPLVKAVQEQQQEIELLRKEIKELKEMIRK